MINVWIPNDDIQDVFRGDKHAKRYSVRPRYDWLRIYQCDAEPMANGSHFAARQSLRQP